MSEPASLPTITTTTLAPRVSRAVPRGMPLAASLTPASPNPPVSASTPAQPAVSPPASPPAPAAGAASSPPDSSSPTPPAPAEPRRRPRRAPESEAAAFKATLQQTLAAGLEPAFKALGAPEDAPRTLDQLLLLIEAATEQRSHAVRTKGCVPSKLSSLEALDEIVRTLDALPTLETRRRTLAAVAVLCGLDEKT